MYNPEIDFTEIHTDGDRAKVKGIISGVDDGTGAVVTTVAPEDIIPEYGLTEVSTIVDEEIRTHGANYPVVDISIGDTSPNTDNEMTGEPAAGSVGGANAMVITGHKVAEIDVLDAVAKAVAKGPCGGYLGSETRENCGNVNKTSVCPSNSVTSDHEVCSVLRKGGNTCNVTLCESEVATMPLVENADESWTPADDPVEIPKEEPCGAESNTETMTEFADPFVP